MTKKLKLSDVAKDLHIPTQELIAFYEKQDANGVKKKGVTGLTTEEINLALEYYSQKSQVENFDAYFATKDQPRSEKKQPAKKSAQNASEKKRGNNKQKPNRNQSRTKPEPNVNQIITKG